MKPKIKSQMLPRIAKRNVVIRAYFEELIRPTRRGSLTVKRSAGQKAANEDRRVEIDSGAKAAVAATSRTRAAAQARPAKTPEEAMTEAQAEALVVTAVETVLGDQAKAALPAEKVRALAACIMRKFQRPRTTSVLARALPGTASELVAQAVVATDFEDSGDAHEFAIETLGLGPLKALVEQVDRCPSPRTYIQPRWSKFVPGERRLTPDDIPNETLRRYVEGNPTLKSAWFKVTGDRSTNEYRFAWLLHKDRKVDWDEAAELCCLLPGGKSSSDPRGLEYAEANVLQNIVDQAGDFGPGLGALGEQGPTAQPKVTRKPTKELTPEEKAQRKAEAEARQRTLGPKKGRKVEWRQKHVPDRAPVILTLPEIGNAPLERTREALAKNRIQAVTGVVNPKTKLVHRQHGQVMKRSWKHKKRAYALALACWLLEEGAPRASVEATLAGSVVTKERAKKAVADVLEAFGHRRAMPGEAWIKAVLPKETYEAIKAALQADIATRTNDADREARDEGLRARAVPPPEETEEERQEREEHEQALKEAAARRHLAQVAHHAQEHHEEGHDAGAPGGPGEPDDPDDRDPRTERPDRVARSYQQYLWRTARRLNQTFFPIGPRSTPPPRRQLGRFVLAYLVLGGVPADVAIATFDEAGVIDARHAEQINREVSRLNIYQVKNTILQEPTLGRRWLKALMSSLDEDLRYNGRQDGLQPGLSPEVVDRVRRDIVCEGHLTTRERMYMTAISRVTGRNGTALADAADCGLYANYMRCEDGGHGPNGYDHGRILIATNRETTCRHCRARWADAYRSYIEKKWPERVFCVRIPTTEIPFEDDPTWTEEQRRMRREYHEFESIRTEATRVKASRYGPPTFSRDKDGLLSVDATRTRILPEGLARRWAFGHGYSLLFVPMTAAPNKREFDQAVRAFAAKTGADVSDAAKYREFVKSLTPEQFESLEPGAYGATSFTGYKLALDRFRRTDGLPTLKFVRDTAAPANLPDEDDPNALGRYFRNDQAAQVRAYTISRSQAAELMVETLHSIGRRFDELLRAESPLLGQFEWLNPNEKRTTSNPLGKDVLPWERDEVQREIGILAEEAQELTDEQRAVPEGHCNQYIPDESAPGGRRICGKPLLVSLVHEESGTVLAQNAAGMKYNRRDADERMRAGNHSKFPYLGDLEPGGDPPLRLAG